MPVYYKIQQNTNSKVGKQGKFYAKTAALGVLTHEQLCQEMQSNCTVKSADVSAVMTETMAQMKRLLQNGYAVHLDGLGTFKITVVSEPADTYEKFTRANIKKFKVHFAPERHLGRKSLVTGATVAEAPKYEPEVAEP